ncbi:Adenosine deaminase [Lachnellula occidentalis]|uniref:Adenosine deaminase n=1 Tax=Lachnellula occidentalis TaxID=215460 RepID=A0A8H8UAH5_9HELO|nr:Adenosine deaminase [Lachnellula occidentalis]
MEATSTTAVGLENQNEAPDHSHPAVQQFLQSREALILQEKERRSDYAFRQSLSPTAIHACKIVSALRFEEQRTVWAHENEMFPGMMFNIAKPQMESTKLWRIVEKMPKGTLLHCHLGAMVDLEWVFNEAFSTPGMCISAKAPLVTKESRQSVSVQFKQCSTAICEGPLIWSSQYIAGTWVPVALAANTFPDTGKRGFVDWMKELCSITQAESLQHHLGLDDVWRKIQGGFGILGPIIYYEPIMRAFLWKFFETLVEDRVKWVEIRAVFATPFTRQGADSPTEDLTAVLGVINEVVENFKAANDFWGAVSFGLR